MPLLFISRIATENVDKILTSVNAGLLRSVKELRPTNILGGSDNPVSETKELQSLMVTVLVPAVQSRFCRPFKLISELHFLKTSNICPANFVLVKPVRSFKSVSSLKY